MGVGDLGLHVAHTVDVRTEHFQRSATVGRSPFS